MSERSIALVVSDLDGSLWDETCTLHAETSDTLGWMAQRALPFIAATGRRRKSAAKPLTDVGLGALPRVLLNGSLGIDGDDVFHMSVFDGEEVESILDAFAEVGHVPCAYVEHPDVDVFCAGEPTTSRRHMALLDSAITVGDRASLVAHYDVVGFSVLGVSPIELEAVAALINNSGTGVPIVAADVIYGAHSLMVQPPGISKWTGIESYCRRNGIDPANVAAVGDGHNDIEMLAQARIAIVPSSASEAALAVADIVIDPPGRGGWRQVRELLDGLE